MKTTNERIVEILEMAIHQLESTNNTGGICHEITMLKVNGMISCEEEDEVTTILKLNKPNKDNHFAHFTESPYWIDFMWWWDRMLIAPETRAIRVQYLKELINTLK